MREVLIPQQFHAVQKVHMLIRTSHLHVEYPKISYEKQNNMKKSENFSYKNNEFQKNFYHVNYYREALVFSPWEFIF